MTVAELIQKLEKMPGWLEVRFDKGNSDTIHASEVDYGDVSIDSVVEIQSTVWLSEDEE